MAMVAAQQQEDARWWHLLSPQVVETPQGLFRPSNRFLDHVLPAIGVLLVVGMFLWVFLEKGRNNYFILGYLGLVILHLGRTWRVRRRYGPMGQPLVRIDGAEVHIATPQNVRPDHVRVPLADIRVLAIKGTPGQLSYILERHAGEPIEARPGFGSADPRVVDFLQRAMPANIPVEVHEPPTFLGAIRGD